MKRSFFELKKDDGGSPPRDTKSHQIKAYTTMIGLFYSLEITGGVTMLPQGCHISVIFFEKSVGWTSDFLKKFVIDPCTWCIACTLGKLHEREFISWMDSICFCCLLAVAKYN